MTQSEPYKKRFGRIASVFLSSAIVGLLCGISSALFLFSLTFVTNARESNPWLLYLLPLAGIVIVLVYAKIGSSVAAGNTLLIDAIHDPKRAVPFRMLPLIFIGTVITHLFGGSAGREGTAVQMGGALANKVHGMPLFRALNRRVVLMSGISGGFGSVFGTPLAGAIFGFEILGIGKTSIEAIVPCVISSCVGHVVCHALGVNHLKYTTELVMPNVSAQMILCILVAGLAFGATSQIFVAAVHSLQQLFKRIAHRLWIRPFVGGVIVVGLTLALQDRSYLGLSIPLIQRSFSTEGVPAAAFLLKIIFTAVTIASGFKGGEVTPLMCVGATLGATLAHLTGMPVPLFAALGFVSVFGAAANAPLACAVMGMELFGFGIGAPLLLCSGLSFLASGERGLYLHRTHGKLIHLFSTRRGRN